MEASRSPPKRAARQVREVPADRHLSRWLGARRIRRRSLAHLRGGARGPAVRRPSRPTPSPSVVPTGRPPGTAYEGSWSWSRREREESAPEALSKPSFLIERKRRRGGRRGLRSRPAPKRPPRSGMNEAQLYPAPLLGSFIESGSSTHTTLARTVTSPRTAMVTSTTTFRPETDVGRPRTTSSGPSGVGRR